MVSLKDTWQQQRMQRQQEALQRQQNVAQMLTEFQRDRHQKATELQQGLTEFQQNLQETTQQLLADMNADRLLMAQQVSQGLSEFSASLTTSVAALRQNLQQGVQQLKQETQDSLQSHRQERLQLQLVTMQALSAFMDSLKIEVQDYLSELEDLRQTRSQQIQTMLKEDSDRRHGEVKLLFADLAEFRAKLTEYCADLHQTVWGSAALPSKATAQKASVATVANGSDQSNASAANTATKSAAKTAIPKAIAQPKAVVASGLADEPEFQIKTVAQSTKATSTKTVEAAKREQAVLTYLQQSQGARLTQIMAHVGISRAQAVETLSTLIKKGSIGQRDRLYCPLDR